MPYIDVKGFVEEWKEQLKAAMRPDKTYQLTVIQVGDDPASNAYIRGKKKDCEELGVVFKHVKLADEITTEELAAIVARESAEAATILQLPVPKHIDTNVVFAAMDASHDVDGLTGRSKFKPCTPSGIIKLLKSLTNLDGARVCVIGRSAIVGMPLAHMLTQENATVTLCHSHTVDIIPCARECDIIVSAVGRKWLVDSKCISGRTEIIVDVGINRENGKLYGDVWGDEILCGTPDILITPVPGGVGLLTRCALMENVIKGG